MVSHNHKCIFVHIPKTAGISIEQVFLDDLNLDFNNRASLLLGLNSNKTLGPPRLSHLTATEYLQYHFVSPSQFDSYFKFSIVRNPYDRIYSFYRYLGYSYITSFEDYVTKYLSKIIADDRQAYFVQPMYKYLYSTDGRLMVDFVGKLENINEDFEFVQRKLGMPIKALSHKNNSREIRLRDKTYRLLKIIKTFPFIGLDLSFQTPQKQFSNRMKTIVEALYHQDFELFGYEV